MSIDSPRKLFEATTPNALRDATLSELDDKYNAAHGFLTAGPDEGTQRQVAASMKAILREIDRRESRKQYRLGMVSAAIAGASVVIGLVVTFGMVARIQKLERAVESSLKRPSQSEPASSEPKAAPPAKQGTQP